MGVLSLSPESQNRRETVRLFKESKRQSGTFTRSFTIPESTMRDKVTANYINGLLRVHLPNDPAGKTRSIDVAFEPVAK
jgi:HSP20 family molecular chaperone IbpA